MKRFRTGQEYEVDGVDMANVLVLLSRGSGGSPAADETDHVGGAAQQYSVARVFECKTCNRQFHSFQALGGHRASHKKQRLEAAGPTLAGPPQPVKPRVHECSVCGLEFAIGQALGGHMRRHRVAAEGVVVVPHHHPTPAEKKATGGGEKRPGGVLCFGLDLNLPASENDKDFLSLNFGVSLPMVDCSH